MNKTLKETLILSSFGFSLGIIGEAHAMKRAEVQFTDDYDPEKGGHVVVKRGPADPGKETKKKDEALGQLKFDEKRQEYYYGNIIKNNKNTTEEIASFN